MPKLKSIKKMMSKKRMSSKGSIKDEKDKKNSVTSSQKILEEKNEPVVDDIPLDTKDSVGDESTIETDKSEENASVTVAETVESEKDDSKETEEDENANQIDEESAAKEDPQQDLSVDEASVKSDDKGEAEEEEIKNDEDDEFEEESPNTSRPESPVADVKEEDDEPVAETPRVATPPPTPREVPVEEDAVSTTSSVSEKMVMKKHAVKEEEPMQEIEFEKTNKVIKEENPSTGLFCGCF